MPICLCIPGPLLAMRASLDMREPQPFPVYVLGQAEVNRHSCFQRRVNMWTSPENRRS